LLAVNRQTNLPVEILVECFDRRSPQKREASLRLRREAIALAALGEVAIHFGVERFIPQTIDEVEQ
jgi:hypothetical protein